VPRDHVVHGAAQGGAGRRAARCSTDVEVQAAVPTWPKSASVAPGGPAYESATSARTARIAPRGARPRRAEDRAGAGQRLAHGVPETPGAPRAA
jgi:hypothetical protein